MNYSVRPIAFRPEWVEEFGDIETTIFYQQIAYWSDKGKREDGFIYKTIKEIEYETTLTARQQRRVRDKLIKMGYIEVKKVKANGSPTLHYKMVKWNVTKGNIPMLQNVTIQCDKTSHSITESTTESTTKSNTNVQQSLDECPDFITFYNAYPRKEGKGQARRAFNTAKKKVSLEKMLASLKKHKQKWKDPKYIPLPATWLNGERWDDDIQPFSSGKTESVVDFF